VLEEATVARMCRNAMGGLRCRKMKSVAPGSTNDVDFLDGMEWGLSFLINPESLPTGRSAGSLAWAGLANSYFWIDPSRNLAGVYAAQLLPFMDPDAAGLFGAFESAVYEMA
jgi:methyl acetate hydrolase